jgi:hypothetical protein
MCFVCNHKQRPISETALSGYHVIEFYLCLYIHGTKLKVNKTVPVMVNCDVLQFLIVSNAASLQ